MDEDDAVNAEAVSDPLIVHDGSQLNHDGWSPSDGDSTLEIDADSDESALTKPNFFVWSLTLSAGLSGLLFGYDTGIISSTLLLLTFPDQPITTLDKSLITSCTSLFAFFASPLTGFLADAWGRKRVLLAADALFVIGAIWQACTNSVGGMILGRSIVGAAVGSASFVVPLYISELSPTPFRGRLVTVASLLITGGQVVAYVIGYLLSPQEQGWRWMVGLGAVPAAVQLLMLGFMPETPRWLIKVGRKEQARIVLGKVYKGCVEMENVIAGVLRRIQMEVDEEERASSAFQDGTLSHAGKPSGLVVVPATLVELLRMRGNRRALIIACMLQAFQQLCGFNSLMYFSATIFFLVGFNSPTLTSLCIAITNFLFTLVAFYAIDRVGRRRILLWSIPFMIAGLGLCAVAFHFIGSMETVSGAASASSLDDTRHSMTWSYILLVSLIIYVSFYAVGLGNIPWQQSELFPLRVRALGSGLATATNWASNFVVGLTFLPLMQGIGATQTFGLYALVCMLGYLAVWRIYPETSGLSLEEVGHLLAEGWGVSDRDQERVRKSRVHNVK